MKYNITDEYLRKLFGKNLTRILAERDLSHTEFAQMMGVSKTQVSRWTTGSHPPVWRTFAEICEALGALPNDFMVDSESDKKYQRARLQKELNAARTILDSIEKKVSGL